jgi:hypothetical protein
MIDSTLVTDDLELAIRILVHETRTTLGALRPVIAGLESGAPLPAAGAAVARLDAIERVLARVAAVYRRRLALRDQLSPAELAQLRAAVAGLSSVQAVEELMVPGPPGPPRLAEELEIALRVLVHEVGNALTAIKPLVDVLASRPGWLLALPAGQRVASARLALARLDGPAARAGGRSAAAAAAGAAGRTAGGGRGGRAAGGTGPPGRAGGGVSAGAGRARRSALAAAQSQQSGRQRRAGDATGGPGASLRR